MIENIATVMHSRGPAPLDENGHKPAHVRIDRGAHNHPVPPRTEAFIEEMLLRAGVNGKFRVLWGPSEKGTAHSPRFRVKKMTDRHNIELLVKPGSNNTSHTCWIAPDNNPDWSLEALLAALSAQGDVTDRDKLDEMRIVVPFCNDERNVDRLLRVLAGEPVPHGEQEVAKLYARLDQLVEQRSARGWGVIVATLERRGLLVLSRSGERITSVVLAPRGEKRIAGSSRSVEEVKAEIAQSVPALHAIPWVAPNDQSLDQALQRKQQEIEQQQDALVRELVAADDAVSAAEKALRAAEKQLADARGRATLVSARADQLDKQLQAVRTLRGEEAPQ